MEELSTLIEANSFGINTAWVIICAFLVFFMQAGFALVETGLTRAKNSINIMMKNLMDMSAGVLVYFLVGFAFMFGAGNGFIGTEGFLLNGFEETFAGVPTYVFWFFQAAFAGVAATIVSGALAERVKFQSYLIYSILLTGIIYPVVGHWTWGGGWLTELGFIDFAGSTVVHSVGGWAALIGTLIIGPRIGRFSKDKKEDIGGHNIPLFALGVLILWFGWYGFNPGSQLAITGENAAVVGLITINTTLAAGAGAVAAMMVAWIKRGKPDAGLTMNGTLAGLVAITAPCAFVTPLASILIGTIGGIVVVIGIELLNRLKIDDAVGAAPVHAFVGVWGTIAVGIFHTELGAIYGAGFEQIKIQLIGIVAVAAWTIISMAIIFKVIDMTLGLRASAAEEQDGLDKKHCMEAYPDFGKN